MGTNDTKYIEFYVSEGAFRLISTSSTSTKYNYTAYHNLHSMFFGYKIEEDTFIIGWF